MLVGLTIGRLAVRQNTNRFENITNCAVRIFTVFNKAFKEHCYHGITNAFRLIFQLKCIVRYVGEG